MKFKSFWRILFGSVISGMIWHIFSDKTIQGRTLYIHLKLSSAKSIYWMEKEFKGDSHSRKYVNSCSKYLLFYWCLIKADKNPFLAHDMREKKGYFAIFLYKRVFEKFLANTITYLKNTFVSRKTYILTQLTIQLVQHI